MVPHRDKKKLDDRTCEYCGKEFRYPYIFNRHKITRCWINGESSKNNSRQMKGRDGSIKNLECINEVTMTGYDGSINNLECINDGSSMVPIHLSLV
jgi:hypothetical protein